MSFLPQDYEAPKSNSLYMKIEDGENKIRILTAPILGWEDWNDKKPIRFRYNNKPDKSIDPRKPLRHFWAFIVWNYAHSKIQILEITQATVRKRLEEISKDKDWGSPFEYDIKIIKSGKDEKTTYGINPSPKRDLESGIKEEFAKIPMDLEELFRGGDPSAVSGDYRTKAFWEKPVASAEEPTTISPQQVAKIEDEIQTFIAKTAPEWRANALRVLQITSFAQLDKRRYDLMIKRIEEKKLVLLGEDIPF